MLGETGVKSVTLPPRSPNLNAHAERFVRSIKESCLERMILFGEESLRKAVHEFVGHYHHERNHQGLANQTDWPRSRSSCESQRGPAAPAPGRHAELLLPRCGLICRRSGKRIKI